MSILAKNVELKEIVDVRSFLVSSCGNVPRVGITFIYNFATDKFEWREVGIKFGVPAVPLSESVVPEPLIP